MKAERPEPRMAVEREIFLRSMALGRPAGRDNGRLGDSMREVFFEAGRTLYEAGDPSDEIFFIVRGVVEARKPGAPPRRFDARSVVGVLDATREVPHDRSAVAVTDVEALLLRNEDRLDALEDSFEYTREIILFTAESLHELTLRSPTLGAAEPQPQALENEALPDPLPLIERVLTLREVAVFAKASLQTLISLAPVAHEVRVPAGATLFRAGEVHAVFYVVARGCIELTRETPPGRARFGPATMVGGAPALGDAERIYTAQAVTDSVLLCFREGDFFDVLEDHFDLTRSVLACIASERIRLVEELEREGDAAAATR